MISKKRRTIVCLSLLIFMLLFSIPNLFSRNDFDNDTELETSATNYLFNGKNYTFNLDNFYDDTNLSKNFTSAEFQTEWFNDTEMDWSGIYDNDTVLPVNNTEIQYGNPNNVSMINGTTDSTDSMKVKDDSGTNFTSGISPTSYIETPDQWDDFTFTNGTGVSIEDIETIDGDYSVLRPGDTHYNGTYSFEDDTPGGNPTDWVITERVDGTVNVIAHQDGHDMVMEIWDDNNAQWVGAENTFVGQASGTIEFWIQVSNCSTLNKRTMLCLYGSAYRTWFYIQDEKFQYYDGVVKDIPNVDQPPIVDNWYHIRIDFECTAGGYLGLGADQIRYTINGISSGALNFQSGDNTLTKLLIFSSGSNEEEFTSYWDAFGYYWDPTYDIGDNLLPLYYLNVQVDMQVVDPACDSVEFLKYSHKTNVSSTMDLDIWNWTGSVWYEIESVDNFASFDDDSFTLGVSSDYVSGTFQVRIRFQSIENVIGFELQIDRLRLDYMTSILILEFTVDSNFARYNEDLLALNVSCWQMTNITQLMNFSIWNFTSSAYVQINSSSDLAFAEKTFGTISPSDFINSTGSVRLHWIGENVTNNFNFSIDFLTITITYKLDLEHSKAFDTNGVFRYRWEITGSLHYTQWVTFEVIDPVPNFYAISESDVTTRWRLQGAEISPTLNFSDDLSPSNTWYLNDVSQDWFFEYLPDIGNYLLDNYSYFSSSYMSPTQFTDFSFTEGAGNAPGELETNDADEAIIDAGFTSTSDQTLLGTIVPDADITTDWNDPPGDAPPHWSKLNEAPGDMDGDGGNIRESTENVHDKWSFTSLVIPAGRIWTKYVAYCYMQTLQISRQIDYVIEEISEDGYWSGSTTIYRWRSDTNAVGFEFGQTELDAFTMKVDPKWGGSGWADIEAVYVEIYTSLMEYSVDYTITWDVVDPESIETFYYDYRTTIAVDCDLDIWDWTDSDWDEELESNTGVGFITDSYDLTDRYISGSDQIKIRFQSGITTDFDMELDQIVFSYNAMYNISKKHNNTIPGYAYMQTNVTELISLESTDYGSYYNLSSGDYFEIFFQTSSGSEIKLILLRDGGVNKTLTLSPSENAEFDNQTVKISVSEFVEFDQLKFNSTFGDTDYLRIYDIKTYKYTLTGDYYEFFVSSHNQRDVYIVPDTYNVRISEWIGIDSYSERENFNMTIPTPNFYVYVPIPETPKTECRLTLFPDAGGLSLTFTDYQTYIDRWYDGEAEVGIALTDPVFFADSGTSVNITVNDQFGNLLHYEVKPVSDFINVYIDVYRLEIINLMTQKTPITINHSLYIGELASGRWIDFMLSEAYYEIRYENSNGDNQTLTIFLDSNQVYELNRSKICFLSYADQQGNHLYFENYKTYVNGSLLYENVFYREIGDIIGIEIMDRYNISIVNDTHTVISGDNYIPITLTMYSLKVMSLQLLFNHVNITRNSTYYGPNPYSWSVWLAPRETVEFRLFAGYYKINITNNEDSSSTYYSYTLNGDDYILIGSNNTIYNVLVNLANVNTTLGNQITNVEINITNWNSAINNTVINIQINLDNVNSSLGTLLLDIDTAISNINTSIINEIVSLGTVINNINTSITNEILNIGVNITNMNSSIVSQLLTLGVDISNINGSIIDQIVLLGINVTNVNTTLSDQILSIEVDISNLDTSITDQFSSVISNITNVNTTILTQISSLSTDITNINSSIVNQIVSLGVNLTNINTSISNQILAIEVDLTNINSSIINQTLLIIADIVNTNSTIYNQTLVMLSDISNVNSTLLNQMVAMGVNISNVNVSISNLILDLNVDLTNINSSITTLLTNIGINLTNIENDIYNFYANVNTSFVNLDTVINNSFIYLENNIISFNQSISNLVIGVSNGIYLINGTISTMITSLETNLLLMNVSIDTNLISLNTTLNVIGANITNNYILLNNTLNLIDLNINDSRIAVINNLLLINNTISALVADVYSAVYLINNSIYTAVVDLGTYLGLINNTITGNLSIVLEQNEFLTELYQMTMFSDMLNWTNIGLNVTLLTSQVDVWTLINNYKNQSIEVHLRYQDLIEELVISADDLLEQYLPSSGVEYREWSVELQEYVGEWTELDPDDKVVDFGFYETEVPREPEVIGLTLENMLWSIALILGAIGFGIYIYSKIKETSENKYKTMSKNQKKKRKDPRSRKTSYDKNLLD